ncbi:unnamed protein product [Lathyrus sativus]|nr:unnamed protein product [Lathyrus sativus]
MCYKWVLILFLAVVNLTVARNSNYQTQSNEHMMSYQHQPTTDPEKPVSLNYDPPIRPNQQRPIQRKLRSARPKIAVPNIAVPKHNPIKSRIPGRHVRPPPSQAFTFQDNN